MKEAGLPIDAFESQKARMARYQLATLIEKTDHTRVDAYNWKEWMELSHAWLLIRHGVYVCIPNQTSRQLRSAATRIECEARAKSYKTTLAQAAAYWDCESNLEKLQACQNPNS